MFTVSKGPKSLGKSHSIQVNTSSKAFPPLNLSFENKNGTFGKAYQSIPRFKLRINHTVTICQWSSHLVFIA